ncbi:sodium:proton antiporter [Bacteroidia bacterium]|nr:sodium:proton antiporter [Bacteroidia bacterium]
MKKLKVSLLGKIGIAIGLGILCGQFFPAGITRLFLTFNSLFGNFLSFAIPLIIVGLVAPAIGEIGKGAGKWLLITVAIAYGSTLFSGFFTYLCSSTVFPQILIYNPGIATLDTLKDEALTPYFTIDMPPLMDIMSALLLSFIVGIGLSVIKGVALRNVFLDFREVVNMLISSAIIPLLPLYIFGIFLNITISGQVGSVMSTFVKIIVFIFAMHVVLLLIQFTTAGAITKRNPFVLLKNMLPAYATALGTQSSAATIPVTLRQALKNGVRESVATFVVPLCATIHLAGSTMKIVACSMAIMYMVGNPVTLSDYSGFIMMLGVTMVAAPGVPGGAVMAALGLLEGMLGFNETMQGLMIAIYIAMDSFGTACNVTGDGAIAIVMDKIVKQEDKYETA